MAFNWTANNAGGGGKVELKTEVAGKHYRLAYNVAPIAALSEWKLYEWRRKFWMSLRSTRGIRGEALAAAKGWAEALIAEDQRKIAKRVMVENAKELRRVQRAKAE